MKQMGIERGHDASLLEGREAYCLHCNSPIDSHKTPIEGSSGKHFCCSGCRAVYELLERKNLTSYYKVAEKVGATLTPVRSSIDETSVAIREASGTHLTFHLSGIHCASCVWLLERLPQLCDGVLDARVSLTLGDISIHFNPSLTSPDTIAKTIRTLGYSIQTPQQAIARATPEREALIHIGIAGACAMNIMVLAVSLYQGVFTGIEAEFEKLFRWVSLALSIPVVGYCAIPIYTKALGSLRAGTLHIDLPITIGILLSFLLGAINTITGGGEIYFDSVATIIFLLLSTRYMQRRAFEAARRSCSSQWALLPPTIREISSSGNEREIPLTALRPGMLISVKAGERIPCDGTVASGQSSLDCSTITGESLPALVERDSAVLAGSLNIESPLTIRSATEAGTSRLDRIISSVTTSIARPPQFITALDTFSILFTASAILLAGGAFIWSLEAGLQVATSAAIAMLTVTCPCAVALALPLLSIRALSTAAASGVLVKSPDVFENLPRISRIFLDKTGTLTQGALTVRQFLSLTEHPTDLRNVVLAHLTSIDPNHPVSRAIQAWAPDSDPSPLTLKESKRLPGRGVQALFARADGTLMTASLTSLAHFLSTITTETARSLETTSSFSEHATITVVAINGEAVGAFALLDSLRPETQDAVNYLSSLAPVHILSGDRREVTFEVASKLRIDTTKSFGALLPEEKAQILSAAGDKTLFAGDGANDALALTAASVGVALRGGIQSILESADVFIYRGGIEKLPLLHRIAIRYCTVSRGIVGLGLTYNAVGIGAAFLGYVSPLVAAIAMPIFSSILLIISYCAFVGFSPSSMSIRKT